jgi:hypothetical protein
MRFRSCRPFPAIGYLVLLAAVMRQARATEPLEIREGLWEITQTSHVASQLPAELLAKFPPEQRAQMLASLKGGASESNSPNQQGLSEARKHRQRHSHWGGRRLPKGSHVVEPETRTPF